MDGPHWAGVVPLTSTFGAPQSATDRRGDPPVPDAVAALEGTDPHA
ncbi:MAG: hypothetical protein HKN94_07765 [Acidimicrobiales bacterium]|nr:hypothetical protein [Acidimicrobiales bacterium]